MLRWYDRHARTLPWRALPGVKPDPYRVWLSEIMLQQTTVTAVVPYYARFLDRFPTVEKLAAAPQEDVLRLWAGLGYYARARNLHACARVVVEKFGGCFPSGEADLLELPGIGAYTAAAIAAIAFDRRATPVDGNIERVVSRLFAVSEPLPAAKGLIRELAATLTPAARPGDFAQALMDLGATICTPKRPACFLCPWQKTCAGYRAGDPEKYPRKQKRAEGRLRRGAVFFVRRADGMVLLRQRPEKGLLGGMTELPTTIWSPDFEDEEALEAAPILPGRKVQWRRVPGIVRHIFTHFPLELTVYAGQIGSAAKAPAGTKWIGLAEIHGEALPNVMRKVIAHATASG